MYTSRSLTTHTICQLLNIDIYVMEYIVCSSKVEIQSICLHDLSFTMNLLTHVTHFFILPQQFGRDNLNC